jgi:hypothetical protein
VQGSGERDGFPELLNPEVRRTLKNLLSYRSPKKACTIYKISLLYSREIVGAGDDGPHRTGMS